MTNLNTVRNYSFRLSTGKYKSEFYVNEHTHTHILINIYVNETKSFVVFLVTR